MPTHYAHLRFGQLVQAQLPPALARMALACPDAYWTGLHGPDVLFYHRPLAPDPIRREAFAIHDRPGTQFFEQARQVLARADTPMGRSYLAGFLCHYMLDSACHPLVDQLIAETGVDHNGIETELDRHLLTQEGRDPFRVDTVAHVHPVPELAAAMAPFYPPATPEQVLRAMGTMKRYVRLTRVRNPAVRGVMFGGLRLAGLYDAYRGIFLNVRANPACRDGARRLEARLEETVTPAVAQMQALFAALDSGGPLDPRLKLTFGGRNDE